MNSVERRRVSFTVQGKPEPKGSTRIVPVRGRAVITSDNPKLKAWQHAIAWTVRTLAAPPFVGAVRVVLDFHLARPASTSRLCRHPVHRPDVDKLARAVLDALTGELLRDDAQVVELYARKRFARGDPGVVIDVLAAPEPQP
jgi:crossover junction endodeoxyribonuclease RusA